MAVQFFNCKFSTIVIITQNIHKAACDSAQDSLVLPASKQNNRKILRSAVISFTSVRYYVTFVYVYFYSHNSCGN